MERIVLGLVLCACPLVVGVVAWPSNKAPTHGLKPTRLIFAEPATERRVLLAEPSVAFDADVELVATEAVVVEPEPEPDVTTATLELRGRVRPREGEAAQGWHISLIDTQALGASVPLPTASSAEDGSFSLGGLRTGEYIVAAWRARDYHIDMIASTSTLPGTTTVELEAPSGATEHVAMHRFVDLQDEPFAGVSVGLPGWPACTTTDAEGQLELAGILPARLTLMLTFADGSTTLQEIDPLASRDYVLQR
jgi:hypothetical protein